jgi:signal transduction histidine kinase
MTAEKRPQPTEATQPAQPTQPTERARPTPTDERLAANDLRDLFLFEALTDEQRTWLAERGWVESYPAGECFLTEGEPALKFVVLLDGTIALTQRVGNDDVQVTRSSQVGAYAGATRSFVKSADQQTYTVSVRAITDVRLFVLADDDLAHAIQQWFPMAIHLLEGLSLGYQAIQREVGQRQYLQSLSDLSDRLTHELNNPAAAAVRATDELKKRVAGQRTKLAMLAHDKIDKRLLELLVDTQEEAVQMAADAPDLSAVEETEREDELTDWLEAHSLSAPWELAPIFVSAGATSAFLDKIEGQAPPDLLEGAVRWIAYTIETELLLGEISDSMTRISTLVDAAKDYSRAGRFERVDVHKGIKSTLVILGKKLEHIEVVKDFDRSLPPVPAYAAELNQVWTNLIDNAIQAMGGRGRLTITTQPDGDERVLVTIGDNGPGVPAELQQRIFEPFFTTKPVGHGTGLGLDISYRIVVGHHGGDIRLESTPGDTRFIVCLPVNERAGEIEDAPAS